MDRETVRAKYVEGREPILPPGRGEVPPKDCCPLIGRILIAVLVVLILIVVVLLLR
jgi:hypothetical protein